MTRRRSIKDSVTLWLWSPFVALPPVLLLIYVAMQQEHTSPPIVDVQMHYNEDAWSYFPVRTVINTLEKLNVDQAVVSSIGNAGTRRLTNAAPDRFLPLYSIYQTTDDRNTWHLDDRLVAAAERGLSDGVWYGIGEVHVLKENANAPAVRRLLRIAVEYDMAVVVHAYADTVALLTQMEPRTRLVWAHAGMTASPLEVDALLSRNARVTAELSHRQLAPDGELDPEWRELLLRYSDRMMVGSGTYRGEYWHYYRRYVQDMRRWLAELPPEVAERIAHGNARRVFLPYVAGAR